MKKLFLICTAVGLLAACNSNKRNASSSYNGTSAQAPKTNSSNNVNRINEESDYAPKESKSHLDSLMDESGSSSGRYNHKEGNFKGASGAGTGGSYAGTSYAQSRYKKKPNVKRIFDAPVEDAKVNNNNTIDSTNLSKELSDFDNINDSTSTNLNHGW